MNMKAKKTQLFSVSEAAATLDVSKSTIHTHMAKRRLNPVQPVDQRDPAGARLDASDLVLISCFQVFSRHGVTWGGLDASGRSFLAAVWAVYRNAMPPELKEPPEGPGIGRRVFQKFFELCNYRAFLVAVTSPEKGTFLIPVRHTALAPFMNALHTERLIGLDGVIVINVEAHYTAILKRLAGVE
jgi:hypothetical protein